MRRRILVGIIITTVVAFVFVPVIQVPYFCSGVRLGPHFVVFVSISHLAFGFGGKLVHNLGVSAYEYSVDA
jgi:hypothetical protein